MADDFELRRPPLLWEQRLQALIPNVGLQGVADSQVTVDAAPGPGAGEQDPVDTPVVDEEPDIPRVPSTPIVAGTTLGLNVVWDGKDSDGVLFPAGTSVQVHASDTTGFTPGSGTLKGVIPEAGGSVLLGGLTAGVSFFVRFIAVAPDGTESDPSAQASASVGLVQGPEIAGDSVITQIVSATTPATTFKLGSIWINTSNGTYNVLQDVGGTPTWVKREWEQAAIAANAISANQIAAQAITTKFLTGEIIRTGPTDAARVQISAANGIEVFRDATNKTFWAKPSGEVVFGTTSVSSGGVTVIDGGSITTGTINVNRLSVVPLTAGDVGSGGGTTIDGGRITTGTINVNRLSVVPLTATDVGSGGTTTIDGGRITTGSISGDRITGGTISGTTITGSLLQTRAGGNRIRIQDNVSGPYGTQDAIEFVRDGTSRGILALIPPPSPGAPYTLDCYSDGVAFLKRDGSTGVDVYVGGTLSVLTELYSLTTTRLGASGGNVAFRVGSAGGVFSYGIDDNTTANAANVRVGGSAQLLRSTSTARLKDDLVPLIGDLAGVPAEKISDEAASIDPRDVLLIAPTEFRSLSPADGDARMFGLIAEDVAAKLPWAANWDEEGIPSAVEDRPILAALLFVVREQQEAIAGLSARLEALEVNQG
jgi:hypothetical protein